MCDPITLFTAAATTLGIGQQVAGFVGQQQQAASAREAADANFRAEFEGLAARGRETEQADALRRFDQAIQAQRERGRIAAAGNAAGLSATSLGAQLRVSAFEEGQESTAGAIQNEFDQQQIQREADNAAQRRQSIVNANQGPNPLSLVLGIGGAATQGATTFAQLGGRLPGTGTRG